MARPRPRGHAVAYDAETDLENTMYHTAMPAAPDPARTRRRGLL
jgi:hypothetical protein